MAKTTVKLLIDPEKNSLTFSKNFRIFSTLEPVTGLTGLTDLVEDLVLENAIGFDITNLTRYFRYSRNRLDWSLWYQVSPTDLGDAGTLPLDKEDPFYFELKYEYDDGTGNEINGKIEVNEIKLRFNQASSTPTTYSPITTCSDETCTSIVVNRDPSFRPYEVDSAIGMFRELSYFTNQLYGHQVVYFRTLPEVDSGDYIFKEWTLYKNVDRKCIKVLVPKNAFPSNAPKYTEFGLDFQLPFEIHVDHRYFQSIFGNSSEPRKRDFLYFPLINRMFEIQGSYLHRGLMMAPTYWKIQLKKYSPNIDMLLKDDTRHFLDNVITNAEQLFSSEVEKDTKDATLPQQYQTISTTFDSSRRAIHPELITRPLKYTYNFASLIDNYYDLSSVPTEELAYQLTDTAPSVSTGIHYTLLKSLDPLNRASNYVALAYESSDLYRAWRQGDIRTNDRNVQGTSTLFCRVRGPYDSIPNSVGDSPLGRYLRVEAYRDLSFRDQRNILAPVIGGTRQATFRVRQSAVVYSANPKFNLTDTKNLSYTCLFKVPSNGSALHFLEGFDPETGTGLRIEGAFSKYTTSETDGDLNLTATFNSQVKSYSIPNFKSGAWHAIVFSLSNEFKQCGMYVYSIVDDPADVINHNALTPVFSSQSSMTQTSFDLTQHYVLPSSNISIANLRLFNTMIKEEQHEFILSQQFIKDESMLLIIDNCRPQVNIPYIAKNR
jgi:hypothetical protein